MNKNIVCGFLILLLLLTMLTACGSIADMTITDQNGKTIEVSSSGNDTYTFRLPDSQPTTESSWDNPFVDVAEGAWYYRAVRYCCENDLMRGTSNNTFSPEAPISRAMIVTVLWHLEGRPSIGRNTFSDVPEDHYYADAIAWAASQNIISGYSEDVFAPEDPITRQQLAVILYRFAEYNGWDTQKSTSLDGFTDAHISSAYAQKALSWAAAYGIIDGMDDSLLTPQGKVSRAQAASALMKLCENIGE